MIMTFQIQLTDDGDVLATNVTWPPQLMESASSFLQETKAALQRAHADSDNFGGSNPSLLKVIREVRKACDFNLKQQNTLII